LFQLFGRVGISMFFRGMRLPVSGSIILGDDCGGGEYTGRVPPVDVPLPEGTP
jgi:hypothetical protein